MENLRTNKNILRGSAIALLNVIVRSGLRVQVQTCDSIMRSCSDSTGADKYLGFYSYSQNERKTDEPTIYAESLFVVHKVIDENTFAIMQISIPKEDEIKRITITETSLQINELIIFYHK